MTHYRACCEKIQTVDSMETVAVTGSGLKSVLHVAFCISFATFAGAVPVAALLTALPAEQII